MRYCSLGSHWCTHSSCQRLISNSLTRSQCTLLELSTGYKGQYKQDMILSLQRNHLNTNCRLLDQYTICNWRHMRYSWSLSDSIPISTMYTVLDWSKLYTLKSKPNRNYQIRNIHLHKLCKLSQLCIHHKDLHIQHKHQNLHSNQTGK